MPHCAVKTCGNKSRRKCSDLSFHRLPVREPKRLKLWLSALNIGVNTPVDELKKYVVCSEHFVPEDYSVRGQPRTGATHRYLTPTAVPTVGVSSTPPGVTEDPGKNRIKDESMDYYWSEDTQELLPSLHHCEIKVEEIPVLEEAEIQVQPHVKQELVDRCIGPDMKFDASSGAEVRLPKSEPTSDCELSPSSSAVTLMDSGKNRVKDESMDCHWSEDTQELLPSLHHCDIKVEQIPVLEEAEIHVQPHVKQELVDRCIGPDMKFDASNGAEVRLPKSEPTSDCELSPSSSAVTLMVNESIKDEWNESDGSSSPQSHSIEVYVELEEPPREEKTCRFCGKSFKRDSYLIRHVDKIHNGHKAFKCLECNKEFEQRYQLVLHVRIHTGEKPFSCDYCDKTFVQNSSRLAHMRVHTGEKPYFCAKCGKSFATSNHFKFCKVQNECEITEDRGNADEEKAFKCSECNKVFNQRHQLALHARIHSGEKPFSCDFCGKTFTQNSNRIVHMRQHTGEKPYYCEKCGKRFASSHHLKLCTGTQNKGTDRSFRCATCGRTFHTESDLKVHAEVHVAWKRHLSEKLQGQELQEKKLKVV
ncbi:zinc finger protein 154-like isoform X3 [Sparus aurata]|uniref:zinc finger protein 154-like isoform X3 n=1 Tax=Sparus aurata TaxID=8175 RepID=UPI0011C11319|nr:zinc finger protein 154-like isoform X3 [Sparus aurata]